MDMLLIQALSEGAWAPYSTGMSITGRSCSTFRVGLVPIRGSYAKDRLWPCIPSGR